MQPHGEVTGLLVIIASAYIVFITQSTKYISLEQTVHLKQVCWQHVLLQHSCWLPLHTPHGCQD